MLRRFRITWLEEQGCPRGLLSAWAGHSNVEKYDKTAEDHEFRRKHAERIGTGLNLADALVPQIVKLGDPQAAKKPGTRKDPQLKSRSSAAWCVANLC
jgi:hypothetical protein